MSYEDVRTGTSQVVLAKAVRLLLVGSLLVGGFYLAERIARRLVGLPERNVVLREYSWRVFAIVPTMDDGYWHEMRIGMREAAHRAHVGLEFIGPRYPNPDHIVDRFEQAIAAKADGIICYAEDLPAVASAIGRADRAGIPVVTIGLDLPESGRRSYVGPDPFQMGYEVGRALAMEPGIAEVAVVLEAAAFRPGSSQDRYLSGLRRAVGSARGRVRLRRVVLAEAVAAEAEAEWEALFAGGRIDAICCASPESTLRVAGFLAKRGLKGRVALFGMGLLPETLWFMRQEMVTATAASYPYAMGSDAVFLLADILAGRSHPTKIIAGIQVFRQEDVDGVLQRFWSRGD